MLLQLSGKLKGGKRHNLPSSTATMRPLPQKRYWLHKVFRTVAQKIWKAGNWAEYSC